MTRRTAAAVLALVGLLAAVAALPAQHPLPSALALATGLQSVADAKPLPDPIPLRRVLLAADAPLPAAPDGNPFRPMPREEFEARVQAAARTRVPPPALVQATYRATLTTDSLAGAGEWVVSGAGDAALPLDPLGVAVRDAKWPDGREALLWGSPAKLWVDRRGRTPVAFAWSARGVEEPGAIRFDLALPPAPLAVLELTLPADRVPAAKRGHLLTGPVPAPGNLATWRVAFGGDSKLELSIRRPAGAGLPPPLASFARTAKVDVTPGVATVAVEFETTAVRGPLTTLQFDADPALTVTDVTAPGLDGWQAKDGRVTATFRDPLAAGVVTVAGVAVAPTGGEPWPPPTVRPAAGVLADDRVEVRLAPDVKLDGWSAGDYRLARTAAADGAFALTFRGGLLPDGAAARRPPALKLRAAAAEFTTVDTLDWRVEPGRSHLTGRFRVTATRGPVPRLTFKIPAGFTPLAAVLTPDDATAATAAANGLLTLEPTQPVATGETVEVRVELRGPPPAFEPARRLTWPTPVVALVGPAKREGTLAVQVAPALRGWLSTADPQPLKFTHDPAVTLTLAPGPAAPPDAEPPAEKPPPPAAAWRFSDLAFALTLDPDGRPRGTLAGVIRAAADRTLVVGLPDGATVEEATVEKWADAEPVPGGVRLPVPTPDADGVPFALTYRLPPPEPGRPWRGRTLPTLPGDPPVRARWTFDGARTWPTLAAAADAEPPDGFVLVPAAWPAAAGYALAAVLLGFIVARLVRGRRPRLPLLAVVAALGAAGWLAPPGWRAVTLPPLATALVGVVALTAAARPARGLAVVALAAVPAVAQAPDAATVYLRPSAADPNRLTALVPQSVLDQLAALAAPPLPPVVLTAAEYTGTEADGAGQFTVAWTVHVTRDGPQRLALPLGGVRLEAMALDGAAAYPDASQPNVVHLTLPGRGRHDLTATFAVPVAATAGDREVRFAVPDVPGSRLTFALGPGGRQPAVAGRTGGQAVTAAAAGTTVQADLGRGTAAAVRWREGAAANRPPAATVTEATVWDVTETRAAGTAAFVYQIGRGALSQLTFDLPPGVEPGAVAVRGPAGAANGLRNWVLTPTADGHQALAVDLQTPAEGTLAVSVRLFATAPPTHAPALRVPRATNADVTASYLGVRLPPGLAVEGWQNERLIDFPADAVARDFAAAPDFDVDKAATRFFRRDGAAAAVARPTLRVPPPPPAAQELTWTLGPRADVAGVARWPAGAAGPVVECDVPPGVTVTDVTAADLAGWQRSDNRVRAWFKGDAKDPTLRWAGGWPGYAAGAAVELPGVPAATVRVRPADDYALVPQAGRTTRLLPTPRHRETAYLQEPDAAPPKFVAHPPGPVELAEAETVTRVGAALEQRVALDLRLAPGRPHSFTLQVSRLPAGAETRLEWPAGASVVEAGSDATHRRWQANLAERAEPAVRVVVTTRLPARPEVTLPGVEVLSANAAVAAPDHRLALPDDLQPLPAGGFRRGADGAWEVKTDQPVRLVEAAKPPAAGPAATDVPVATAPAAAAFDPRLLAAGWLAGLAAVVGVARWGSDRWRPEVVAGFGLLAAAACGPAFAAVAGVGLAMRLLRVTRFVSHRVMR